MDFMLPSAVLTNGVLFDVDEHVGAGELAAKALRVVAPEVGGHRVPMGHPGDNVVIEFAPLKKQRFGQAKYGNKLLLLGSPSGMSRSN
jgi:hypothetical protein